jgi:hypothetical protein
MHPVRLPVQNIGISRFCAILGLVGRVPQRLKSPTYPRLPFASLQNNPFSCDENPPQGLLKLDFSL